MNEQGKGKVKRRFVIEDYPKLKLTLPIQGCEESR
jgi:hypothetical protein